jgi:hypothetical protein
MSELKPCPFCGGVAARDIILEDGSNYGGEIIVCKRCLASTRVFFGGKEGLEESWNTRTPAPAEVEGLVDRINDELFCGALKRETKSRLIAALSNKGENLSGDVSVPVKKLEAGRYWMMIPVEISTTGGLLLDRRDGLHGYSLEDYPNAIFFKGRTDTA